MRRSTLSGLSLSLAAEGATYADNLVVQARRYGSAFVAPGTDDHTKESQTTHRTANRIINRISAKVGRRVHLLGSAMPSPQVRVRRPPGHGFAESSRRLYSTGGTSAQVMLQRIAHFTMLMLIARHTRPPSYSAVGASTIRCSRSVKPKIKNRWARHFARPNALGLLQCLPH